MNDPFFTAVRQKTRKRVRKRDEDDDVASHSSDLDLPSLPVVAKGDEKRARSAQDYIAKIRETVGDDADIAKQLEDDARTAQGTRVRRVARQLRVLIDAQAITGALNGAFGQTSAIGHKGWWLQGAKTRITCVVANHLYVFAGNKFGSIVQWNLTLGSVVHVYPGTIRAPGIDGGHVGAVLSLAISSDGKWLLSGGVDRLVRLWDVESHALLEAFPGHRGDILGLAFRRRSSQFFSASEDRTVKVWDAAERLYMETLFGHQAPVQAVVSCNMERCVTVGADRTMRVWKILEESQLVFRGHSATIDCIAMLDDNWFVTGSQDGGLSLWSVARKRPHHTIPGAHKTTVGNGGWITACVALPMSDLIATGSCDGHIRFWRVDRRARKLFPATYVEKRQRVADGDSADDQTMPAALLASSVAAPGGIVTGLCFTTDGTALVASITKEHRLGRWGPMTGAKEGVLVIPLEGTTMSLQENLAMTMLGGDPRGEDREEQSL